MTIASCLIIINETKTKLCRVVDNEKLGYFGNKRHAQNFVLKSFNQTLLSINNQSQRIIVRVDKGYKIDNEKVDGMPRLPITCMCPM